MPALRRNILLVGVLLIATCAQGQRMGWTVRHFDVSNGLPQSSVLDLAVDSMGFLWITTEAGLVRFDGNRFKSIRLKGADNGSPRMRDMIETGTGELLITDARGNLYMEHGHTTAFHIGAMPPHRLHGKIPSIELAVAAYGRATRLGHAVGLGELMLFDQGDGVWGALEERWYHHLRDSTVLSSWPTEPVMGHCWMYDGRLIAELPDRTWVSFDPATGKQSRLRIVGPWPVRAGERAALLPCTVAGRAYFHSGQRLHTLLVNAEAGTIKAMDVGIDLPAHADPSAIALLDKGHSLAVGTTSMGLLLYHKAQVEVLDAREQWDKSRSYYAQLELPDGNVLAAGADGVVRFAPDGTAKRFPRTASVDWVSMSLTRTGDVLVVAIGQLGLLDPRTGNLTDLKLPTVAASTFFAEGDSIWIGNRDWIGYLDANQKLHVTYRIGSEQDRERPIAMDRDPKGRLLLATCEAVLRSTDASCTAFDTIRGSEGLCSRSLSMQPEGILVGTYGTGLWLLNDRDEFRALPMDPLGALTYSHAVVRDKHDRLWVSTNQGIVRCMAPDLLTPRGTTLRAPYFSYLRNLAGMEIAELNGGVSPPALLLRDGRISFASMNGLVRFHPDSIGDPYPANSFLLERIRVDGRTWPVNEPLVLNRTNHELGFEISLPYWGDPVNAQLEYRIPGIEENWVPIDLTTGNVIVARPPPGIYELHLRTPPIHGKTGYGEVAAYFKVPVPFWRTTYGVLLMIMMLALLVWALLRFQSVRLRRRQNELRRLVKERTATLDQRNRDLSRTLEAREGLMAVISHDIVTPLRFIARAARSTISMVGADRRHDLSETLSELSDSAEKLRGNASALLDWIKHDPDRVQPIFADHDLHVEVQAAMDIWHGVATDRGVELKNAVGTPTPIRTDRVVVQVLLGNLIGNAVNHATGATLVAVEAQPEGTDWMIRIVDNGEGMEPAILERAQHVIKQGSNSLAPHHAGTDGQGIGLAIAAGMAHLLEGSLELSSRPGHTVLTVRLPSR